MKRSSRKKDKEQVMTIPWILAWPANEMEMLQ